MSVTGKIPFVILSTQRSGTTLLRLSLNGHPEVRAHDEIFNQERTSEEQFCAQLHSSILTRRWSRDVERGRKLSGPVGRWLTRRFLKRLLSDHPVAEPSEIVRSSGVNILGTRPFSGTCQARAVGFKLMYNQLECFPALQKWLATSDVRIIHLIRSRILEIVVSRSVAESRKVYHAVQGTDDRPLDSIALDVDATVASVRAILSSQMAAHRRFESRPWYRTVFYEDMQAGNQTPQRECLEFLSCRSELPIPESGLKKLINSPVHDLVQNFDQVAAALQAAGLATHPLTGHPVWPDN